MSMANESNEKVIAGGDSAMLAKDCKVEPTRPRWADILDDESDAEYVEQPQQPARPGGECNVAPAAVPGEGKLSPTANDFSPVAPAAAPAGPKRVANKACTEFDQSAKKAILQDLAQDGLHLTENAVGALLRGLERACNHAKADATGRCGYKRTEQWMKENWSALDVLNKWFSEKCPNMTTKWGTLVAQALVVAAEPDKEDAEMCELWKLWAWLLPKSAAAPQEGHNVLRDVTAQLDMLLQSKLGWYVLVMALKVWPEAEVKALADALLESLPQREQAAFALTKGMSDSKVPGAWDTRDMLTKHCAQIAVDHRVHLGHNLGTLRLQERLCQESVYSKMLLDYALERPEPELEQALYNCDTKTGQYSPAVVSFTLILKDANLDEEMRAELARRLRPLSSDLENLTAGLERKVKAFKAALNAVDRSAPTMNYAAPFQQPYAAPFQQPYATPFQQPYATPFQQPCAPAYPCQPYPVVCWAW